MSKKSQLVNKICPSCGKEFESLKSKRQKYCSEKCKEEQNEKYIMYNCDYCGKEIRIKKQLLQDKENGKQKHIYCSRQCSNNSRRTGTMIECDNCGKLFYRRQYHIDRQKNKKQNNFCCMECQQEYRHKQTYEFRKCEVCGNEFEVSRISTQRFCSTECQNKWQTTQVRDLSSHFTSVLIPCDYCGRDHYVKQSKLNNQEHFFCSIECRQSWYAEVFSQTDEYKDKHRKKILKQFENGVLTKTNSKPQIIINNILNDMYIEFSNEKTFEFYSMDNYLLFYDLIIEVQGDYWHANPLKFKNKITEAQYDRINRDKAKHSYIKNKYNIEILYLWENDIINTPKLCELLIKQYVDSKGILGNYHSFNYSVVNGDLILNNDIIIPYQDMPAKQYKQILQMTT